MRTILVACVLLTSSAVRADDGDVKSETTATWLSAGGTLGSLALIGMGFGVYEAFSADTPPETTPRLLKVPLHNWGNGLMVTGLMSTALTPDFGHWYAHEYLTAGLGLRAAGLLVMGIGSLHVCGPDANEYGCDSSPNTGLIAVGVLVYAAGVVHSIATAPRDVRKYNRNHTVTAVPTLVRAGSSTTFGVAGVF